MIMNHIGEYKMNKVVEQVIKGNPFIKSVTTRKAEHSKYTIFDIETTGFSPLTEDIIELSGVKIIKGEISDVFHTFIKPSKSISGKISLLS